MSRSGPNVFIGVGDPDYFSPSYQHSDVGVDSRALTLRRDFNGGASWRTIQGTLLRSATHTPRQCEFVAGDVGQLLCGLVRSGAEATILTAYLGSAAASGCGYYSSAGQIFRDGAMIQDNLSTCAPGDVITLLYWKTLTGSVYARFLKNGRRNILGYSEDLGNAAWQKLNGATAAGQHVTFVNTTSYVQMGMTVCGNVNSEFTLSCLVTSSASTTLTLSLADNSDGVPAYNQATALTANVPTRLTFSVTMGAGYSGNLAVLLMGAGVIAAGTVIRFEELQVNAGLSRDTYQKQSGAAGGFMGHPFTLTDASYRLGLSLLAAASSATMRPDLDDHQFPQVGCQPWGATARISDAGGYSPAASLYTNSTGATSLDAYRRVHATTGGAFGNAFAMTRSRAGSTALIYCEWDYQATDANDTEVGLAATAQATYIGSNATSWGYGRLGAYYHGGAIIASNAAWVYAAGGYPGIIWQPSTGKLWYTLNGVPLSGDPQAGTGAHATNALGDLYPGSSIWQNGRIRVLTHAREQRYRPAYCEAWDGNDMLPEQHYRGRLKSNTEITQGIWFPIPWGGSRRTGSPIGTVEFANQDGRYDVALAADLRDQVVALYEIDGTRARPIARGLVDSLQMHEESVLRVLTRGTDAKLDKRIDQPHFAFGNVSVAPVAAVQDQQLTYNCADSPYVFGGLTANDGTGAIVANGGKIEVRDKGLLVTSFRRGNADVVRGFVRTAAVAGMQSIRNMNVRKLSKLASDYYFLEGFSSWAGDNPVGWTVAETAPNALITQNGNACRFIRNPGAAVASITKALGSVTATAHVIVDMRVTAYTSGDLTISIIRDSDSAVLATAPMNITSTGRFVGVLIKSDAVNNNSLRITAADSTDMTVDSVEFGRALYTDNGGAGPGITPIEYLLVDCGGLTTADYSFTSTSQDGTVGLWSDERPTLRTVLDALMVAWQRDYYTDAEGRLQFVFWENNIESVASYVADIAAGDIAGMAAVEDDLAPALSDSHASRQNYAVHSETDLAGGVSNAERAILIAENRTVKLDLTLSGGGLGGGVSDAFPLHPFYSHALGAAPIESIRTPASESTDPRNPGGVGTYLYRMHRRYAQRRRFYTITVNAAKVRDVRPGDAVRLTLPRLGLETGKTLMVVSKTRRLIGPTIKLKLWG